MTLAIGFDPDSGTIVISGNGVFPARSLAASVSATLNGYIQIDDIAGRGEQHVAWDDVTSLDGSYAPASMDDVLAYLRGEFAKRPAIPDLISPYLAAADLGGHRVVCAVPGGVALASSDDADSAGAVIGLTTAAAAAGVSVPVVTHGPVVEPSWSFAIGPVYLGLDGLLTQDPPATGVVLRIGRATAPTVLLVDLDEPYFLAA